MRGAGQPDEAGAEHPGRDHRRDRDRGGDQRAADRDGGPAVTGLERHPGPDPAGDRARQGQRRAPARPAGPAERRRPPQAGRPARAAARHATGTSSATGSESRSRPARRPAARGWPRRPGSGSASRAGPIGISGEAATATATARQAPRHGHRGDPGQGQRGQAGPGHAQRAQDGETQPSPGRAGGQAAGPGPPARSVRPARRRRPARPPAGRMACSVAVAWPGQAGAVIRPGGAGNARPARRRPGGTRPG